jgi:hypothetical protein
METAIPNHQAKKPFLWQAQQCQQWQGGGGKPPPQTAAQKQAEALQMELMQAQLAASKKPMEIPQIKVPDPAPPPPPPPSQTGSDVLSAEQEARRQAAKRKGIQSTLLASKTNMNALGGAQSLLG